MSASRLPFAKLFDTETYGQVLVMLKDQDDADGLEVQFTWDPGMDGLGLSKTAVQYQPTPEGDADAKAFFARVDGTMVKYALSIMEAEFHRMLGRYGEST